MDDEQKEGQVTENDVEKWPFPDPRVAGVREHYERVKFFHGLARTSAGPVEKHRLLLAGIYSARGVIELILEAADKGLLDDTREDLKAQFCKRIPWYDLIERIRIHDFHRFGLVPPDPRLRVTMIGGPMKLRAQNGAAVYRMGRSGPEKLVTGNSDIKERRALVNTDGHFFDDATRKYVSLDRIVGDFISAAVETIKEFEENVSS